MAWRIGEQVTWGELDNHTIGRVTGIIWVTGRAEPSRLTLQGKPWPDWTGCMLRLKNPRTETGDLRGLAPEQFPGEIPAHSAPPYERDRFLPKSNLGG